VIAAADLRRIFAIAALAGGGPSVIDTGGVALPRAGEAAVQIIQG
jgi:hypothetical protein